LIFSWVLEYKPRFVLQILNASTAYKSIQSIDLFRVFRAFRGQAAVFNIIKGKMIFMQDDACQERKLRLQAQAKLPLLARLLLKQN
jgi:hypothetical protein